MKLLRDIYFYQDRSDDEISIVEGLSDYSKTELTHQDYIELDNVCRQKNVDIRHLKDIDVAKRIATWFDNERINNAVSNWYYSLKAFVNMMPTTKLRVVNTL